MINSVIIMFKTIIALLAECFQITDKHFKKKCELYNNNFIRTINYHGIDKHYILEFENQIKFYLKYFNIISLDDLKKYLNKKIQLQNDKPSLLITFDDGYLDNYEASKVLDKYGIKGVFFISADKIDNDDSNYMKINHINELLLNGHCVGNHTSTHYRFGPNDTSDRLEYEIIESNKKIDKIFNIHNNVFCWCGGEERVYRREAFNIIKDNFEYAFMTCTQIITQKSNKLLLQRTNVEAYWKLCLVKFQVFGLWDFYYNDKLKRIVKEFGMHESTIY